MGPSRGKSTYVVVANDGAGPSDAAIDWAASEADSRAETLLILTTCPPPQVSLVGLGTVPNVVVERAAGAAVVTQREGATR